MCSIYYEPEELGVLWTDLYMEVNVLEIESSTPVALFQGRNYESQDKDGSLSLNFIMFFHKVKL